MMLALRFCFMLRRCLAHLVAGWLVASTALAAPATSVTLSPEQQAWIASQGNTVLSVGFDPYAGMDNFQFRGQHPGFLPALLKDMSQALGLHFSLAQVSDWDDAYRRFVKGEISILYGANPTPERERIMAFTRAVQRYPYMVFTRKDSPVQTLGDLDGRRVGFVASDFVRDQLPRVYRNIHYTALEFDDQTQGLNALQARRIDGFVTAGGGIEHEFLFNFPELSLVAKLPAITSNMTFSALKEQALLADIIDLYVSQNASRIQALARQAQRSYNLKILRLSEAELRWLEHKGEAVVGVAEDYLPFDLYQDGEYRGIAGETLKRIADITGIRFKVVSGPFAQLYDRAEKGSIDVLNIAKTEDRLPHFIYPQPISTERDIIVGLKTSPAVQDVYGLEGKRVAVIDGFWHNEYLRKNLKDAQIVTTANIMASLKLLRRGDVDYTIENPTVVEFYINGLGYTDLVKRGNTSKDSFVYFGVTRQQPELASIMDKALTLVNFEEVKYAGIQSVPTLHNEQSRQLVMIVMGLLVALVGILFVTVKIVRALANQKTQTLILKEREHLLYTDALTGFHNRNYFSHTLAELQHGRYPQTVVVADLNNLKAVNDAHGHAAGDALLVLFARALRQEFPQGKHFRIGGDEFLIILDKTSQAQAAMGVEAVKRRCQQLGHAVAAQADAHPDAAIGYALRSGDEDSLDACIASADARMYKAKARMKTRPSETRT